MSLSNDSVRERAEGSLKKEEGSWISEFGREKIEEKKREARRGMLKETSEEGCWKRDDGRGRGKLEEEIWKRKARRGKLKKRSCKRNSGRGKLEEEDGKGKL